MKSKDIAQKYGVELGELDHWLTHSNYRFKSTKFGGLDVDESQDIDSMMAAFKAWSVQWRQSAQAKQQALASILITSGFSFDGYTITKYSGYISGDDAIQVDRGEQGFFGGRGSIADVGASLMAGLVQIRRKALAELKEAAYNLGCNAVIGVDFDYLTLDPETANNQGGTLYLPYVFGVTANGNAVIIEKNETSALG